MLSKEEKLLYSLSALKEVIETLDIDVEVTLTKNDNQYTINAYKEIERCVVECINNTQPYKFEDLKEGMWVFDSKKKKCIEVCPEYPLVCLEYNAYEDKYEEIEFEENRFFPVQMANVGCE